MDGARPYETKFAFWDGYTGPGSVLLRGPLWTGLIRRDGRGGER